MASRNTRETSATTPKGAAPNLLLFQRMAEPLRSHVRYIHAALSTYHPGPASADVDEAWGYITRELLTLQRDLWAHLKNARDEASHAEVRAGNELREAVARGLNSHLPSIEDVQAAWRAVDTDVAPAETPQVPSDKSRAAK
jgi:hypothetical protein